MEKETFTRNCPQCGIELFYSNKKNRYQANKENVICKNCFFSNKTEKNRGIIKEYLTDREEVNKKIEEIFNLDKRKKKFVTNVTKYLFSEETQRILSTRICPLCSEVIIHTTSYSRRESEGRKCKKCHNIELGERKSKDVGEKNSFYGKKHTEESIAKRLETLKNSEAWKKQLENKRSDEYREVLSKNFSGKKNPRFGKSLKDIWVKKLGEEEGLKRWDEWRAIQKINSTGEKNNMYGKPSPNGSGNGWSGWYNNWFFRSLRELSYMVNEIEANKLKWENGEKSKYKIHYKDWNNQSRTYFPDFVIDEKYIIECKPFNLQKAKAVVLKKEAAIEFCKKNGMEYIIVDPPILSEEQILELYNSKKLIFTPRYEEKFIKKYFNLK